MLTKVCSESITSWSLVVCPGGWWHHRLLYWREEELQSSAVLRPYIMGEKIPRKWPRNASLHKNPGILFYGIVENREKSCYELTKILS